MVTSYVGSQFSLLLSRAGKGESVVEATPIMSIPTLKPVETTSLSQTPFHSLIVQTELDAMCMEIFNCKYKSVEKIIYPKVHYKSFSIKKKSGGNRVISEPRLELKSLQTRLLEYLYKHSNTPKNCVHGFTKERSIVTNARVHCSPKTRYVLNIDLENFFPAITFNRVRGMFQNFPFNLNYENATVLAHLSCYQKKLPQGAPTSPLIANLICRTLDSELMALARQNRAKYTRYCDDITFSFASKSDERLPAAICHFDGAALSLGTKLNEIILKNSFTVNEKKVRISTHDRRLEVTGLTINRFPNVRRKFIDEIRGALHSWEKFGYNDAEQIWQSRPYFRQRRIDTIPKLHRVLWGKLLHLKAVRSGNDFLYTRLAERYNKLISTEPENFIGFTLPISPIVTSIPDASNAIFVVECVADHPNGEMVGSQGTAFAFGEYGLLTCDHVLRYDKPLQPVELEKQWTDDGEDTYFDYLPDAVIKVIHTPTGKSWPVKVAYRSEERDIALLQFESDAPVAIKRFTPLPSPINLHSKVKLLGFPNWILARKHFNLEDCTVTNVFTRSIFQRVEVSALIRSGNSGGPVTDELFRVVGMAQQGATQNAGNNECLCISEIQLWLDEVAG